MIWNGSPQIIQVRNDHDLVLKAMVTTSIPDLGHLPYEGSPVMDTDR